jgi:hypothetical protein
MRRATWGHGSVGILLAAWATSQPERDLSPLAGQESLGIPVLLLLEHPSDSVQAFGQLG